MSRLLAPLLVVVLLVLILPSAGQADGFSLLAARAQAEASVKTAWIYGVAIEAVQTSVLNHPIVRRYLEEV